MSVNDFKRVEEISEFNEDFIKSYNDESDERYLLDSDVHPLYLKKWNLKKLKNL